MVPAHICTDSGLWGWLPLTAPLHPALINPLDAPNCRWSGVMWAGIATSKAGDAAEEGTSGASPVSLATGTEASGAASSGCWGGGLEMVEVGLWWHFLDGGGADDMGECDMAPLKSLYKPSTSDSATAVSIFPNPSISSCCISSISTLAFFSRSKP